MDQFSYQLKTCEDFGRLGSSEISKLGDEEKIVSNSNSAMGYCPEEHKTAVRRCLEALQHACVCPLDEAPDSCGVLGIRCEKMKRILAHEKKCARRLNGDCTVCKQLIALCCYHAKDCRLLVDCPVPYCAQIKEKLCQRIVACRQKRLITVLKQRKQHMQDSIKRYRAIYLKPMPNQQQGVEGQNQNQSQHQNQYQNQYECESQLQIQVQIQDPNNVDRNPSESEMSSALPNSNSNESIQNSSHGEREAENRGLTMKINGSNNNNDDGESKENSTLTLAASRA